MRKLSKLTVLVLTATALATSPFSEIAPIAQDLVSVTEVQAATKTITAKHSTKSYPVIKKVGTYDIKMDDLNDKIFAFQAPKAGTYVFKLRDLRGKDETVEDSFCEMDFAVGKRTPSTNADGYIGVTDIDNPVYVSNWLNEWGNKSKGGKLASPSYAEAYAEYYSDAESMEEYFGMPGSYQLTATVKVKLKKGEKLYFGCMYGNRHGLSYKDGDVGIVTLKVSMK